MGTVLRIPVSITAPDLPLDDATAGLVEEGVAEELGAYLGRIDLGIQPELVWEDGPSVDGRLADALRNAFARVLSDARSTEVESVELPPRDRYSPEQAHGFSRYRLLSYEDGSEATVTVAGTWDELPTWPQVLEELRARAEAGTVNPGFFGGIRGRGRNVGVFLDTDTGELASVGLAIPRRDDAGSARVSRSLPSWGSGSTVEIRYRGPATEEDLRQRYRDQAAAIRDYLGLDAVLMGVYVDGSFQTVKAGPGWMRGKTITVRVGTIIDETGEEGEGDGAGETGAGEEAGGEHGRRDGFGGRRGGPLGTGEEGEGSRLWPSLAGGEALACESFGEEPTVEDLPPDVQARLRPLMEHLGQLLELEVCPYPANFALMLAESIGGRARAVGLAARDNPGKTTVSVRGDGGGNNGLVDVEAEQTPALVYLHLLAEIVPQVLAYGQTVQANYDGLGDGGAVEHVTLWSNDFFISLGRRLANSCALLFAETCRVILLQQLASTREVIEHRQGAGFAQTVAHFESALGIMGQRIVTADLLQRALRRARQLHRGGNVREILSAPDPITYQTQYRAYYGTAGLTIPPLHEESLLSLVEGARVTGSYGSYAIQWLDRDWNHQALDEFKQLRRAFLNRIDPLFFQVEDLRSVYARVEREGGASGYLRELLAELSDANDKTTAKAKSESDGHWFAVETSQYIEARGGRSEFGTRYELHGIHGLADQVLRPFVGEAEFQYNRGVDRAIGRKAGLDALIAIFSTGAIIILGIVCAPLGAVVAAAVVGVASLGFAAHELLEAAEREEIYRSLERPELILSWQEVQLEWTMAVIGAAFSVFDVVAVIRGASTAMKAALRQGARQLVRQQMREMMERIARGVFEQALREAITQVGVQVALTQALPHVIRPVIVPYMQSIAVEHGLGVDIDSVLDGGEPVETLRLERVTSEPSEVAE